MTSERITSVDRWLEEQPTEVLEQLAKHPLIADLYKAKVRQHHRTNAPRAKKIAQPLKCEWLDSRTLRITPEPPSANVIKGWLYNSRAKHRYNAYRLSLELALDQFTPCAEAVTITHTWVTVQPRDEDSFGTSLKPVLDALVDAGVLADDDPAHVRLRFGGQTSGGKGIHSRRGLTLTFAPQGPAAATGSQADSQVCGQSSEPPRA